MQGFIIWIIIFTVIISKVSKKGMWIGIFFIFALSIGIPSITNWWNESNANPFDYARITEVDYKAEVVDKYGSDGKVIITERLTFDIHAASKNNTFWELWRDLPEEYIDGVKVDYKVNSVKQILDDNSEVVYKESPKLYWDDYDFINTAGGYGPGKWYHSKGPYDNEYNFECVLFYVDGLYRETVVFEIEYEMYNAGLRYLDSSELYLSLYSGNTIKYLKSFKGQILFPNDKMPKPGNYNAYTYGTNSHEFAFEESASKNPGYYTFSFELDKSQLKFRPYNQYIEFALVSHGEDKHIFTKYAAVNNYYNVNMLSKTNEAQADYEELPGKWIKNKIIALIAFAVGTLLTVKHARLFNKRIKQKYTFYKPSMEMEYFRDIPSNLDPNFAATLVFCKHKQIDKIEDGYAAAMLSLVRKNYIDLEKINSEKDWNDNNIKIIINHTPANSAINSEMIFIRPEKVRKACPKCGNENGINCNYCIFCGASFGSVLSGEAKSLSPINSGLAEESKPHPEWEKTISNLEPLTSTEEQYYNLILRHSRGIEISLNSFQEKCSSDYQYTTSFMNNIKRSITNIGLTQGYFQQEKYKKPKSEVRSKAFFLGLLGLLMLTIGNYKLYQTRLDFAYGGTFIFGLGFIGSAIYLFKESKKYLLLTEFGEDEYAKWRGLYNFLNSMTLINEKEVIEVAIWEKYLVYGTAFGISEKVIKALQIRCPDLEMSPVLRNPYYRSTHFHTHSHSFSTAARSASFTSRSGGHGGYGGGGRGGGGGGGGH